MKQKTMVVNKFTGSSGWLIFWVIFCWPVAIIYFFLKRTPTEVKVASE